MFYQQFSKLCKENKIAPSKLIRLLDMSKSSNTNWKAGSKPDRIALEKLANYFNVSIDYLLGRTNIKNPPVIYTDELAEIINDYDAMNEEEKLDLVKYVDYIKTRRG